MRNTHSQTCKTLIYSISLILFSSFSFAKIVPNLGAIEKNITYPEGKQIFDDQMKGLPQPKEFGVLPQGMNTQAFIKWIAPNENPAFLTLTGAKAWGTNNLYIGVACFAKNAQDAKYSAQYKDTDCSETYEDRTAKKLYLSVFKWENNQFTPIAKTAGPLDAKVTWNNSNLVGPQSADDNTPVLPQNYKKLDLAPYQLNADTTAFGVRAGFSEGYSGGGAFFEALQLFIIKDNKIINILSEPMYFYQDIAGDWNKDGTRQHDISEGKNILKVLKTQTDGFNDLQIKSLDSKWQQTFKWSSKDQRYKAAKK